MSLNQWCSFWYIPNGKKSTLSRRQAVGAITRLLEEKCTTTVEQFKIDVEPLGSPDRGVDEIHTVELKLVKLTFASNRDARIRAAMLMLSTYDPVAQKSIHLYTKNQVFERYNSICLELLFVNAVVK